jgi:serine/threonine protein kinase
MGDVLKKFGRYFLLDRVAQGGMAEIYRARLASIDGPGRLLVIKRISQGFGGNSEFVTMFKSETQVTMGFNHPNIVQVYDFGEEQKQPYIAMEFVDGKNLRQFLNRFNEVKQLFPVDMAAYIIEQAAAGLHYAHAFKDKISGQPLNIIHRDISPQNIIIAFEGTVKVIDFGIAKASTNSEATRAGIIKGKPSYLSPEQISGEALDGRCDVFALGTVLWELLTGKKLFAGDNDLQILKMIEGASTHVKPPSVINPEVPKELDYIVLKSLAKQREMRYQSAEEFRRALHRFVHSTNPDFNPSDLSYYAKDLFKGEIVEDRKRIQRLNDRATQLLTVGRDGTQTSEFKPKGASTVELEEQEETTTVFDLDGESKKSPATKPAAVAPVSKPAPAVAQTSPVHSGAVGPSVGHKHGTRTLQQAIQPFETKTIAPSESRRTWLGWVAGLIVGTGVMTAYWSGSIPGLQGQLRIPSGTESMSANLVLQGTGQNLVVKVGDRNVGSSLPVTLSDIEANAPLAVTVDGGAQGRYRQIITLSPGETRNLRIVFSSAADQNQKKPGQKTIPLKLNIGPPLDAQGATVYMNGQLIGDPRMPIAAPVDEVIELVIERPGYKTYSKRDLLITSVSLGTSPDWTLDVPMEPVRYGYMTIRTTPSSDAYITIRDASRPAGTEKPIIKRTPFENEKFPVGTYKVQLINDTLGMEKTVESISVSEGKGVTIDERLEIKN